MGTLLVIFLVILLLGGGGGYKFRSKMPGARWRSFWDWALCVSGFVPSLVFGVIKPQCHYL